MSALTAPGPTAMQLSGLAPSGEPQLCVLAKRTYSLVPGKALALAPEQLPLRPEPVLEKGVLVADADIYPWKLRSDVVVRGHVHAPGKREATVEIGVGDVMHRVLAIGERKLLRGGAFGEPAPIEQVPLSFERAYGGWDEAAEKRYGHPFAKLGKYAQANTHLPAYSPFAYPRNRHGRGYVFEGTELEGVLLPNLEDPADRLTPERLVVKHWRAWAAQPLPAGTTWVSPGAFARGIFGGMRPFWEPLPADLPEIKRGLVPAEVAEIDLLKGHPLGRHLANGAPLGLQVPHLKPGTPIRLANVHPKSAIVTFALPPGVPRILVDGRDGKLLATEPVIHHVEIEPDEGRVTILWRGAGPARRAYHPVETARMPLRVEWAEAR